MDIRDIRACTKKREKKKKKWVREAAEEYFSMESVAVRRGEQVYLAHLTHKR